MKNKLTEILFFLIICILFMVNLYQYTVRIKKDTQYKVPSLSDSIGQLQTSFQKYKSMTGKQLTIAWIDIYFYSEYKMNGKIRKNEFDCGIGETDFLRKLGANIVYEDTEMKEQRLKRIVKPYKKINDVQIGDIIIFRRNGDIGHIALIVKVSKTTLRYIDINKPDDGPGFKTIFFSDKRIQNIYPMTFDYWCGNILSEKEN